MADNLNYANPASGTGVLPVGFRDSSGAGTGPYYQRCDTAGIVAHDAAAAAYYPQLIGGFASAAAPSSVSADGDAVQAWFLRNGAQTVVLTAGGALMPGDATTGQFVGGAIAHGASDTGNPLKVGMVATAHGANPTPVASGQRTNVYASIDGIPFVLGGHPNIKTVRLQFTAAQTNTAVIAGSGGVRIVVTGFTVTLDNASTVFPTFLLGFAASTTPTTTQVIGAHGGIPAGGGFSRGDGSGILGISAAGDALLLTTTGAATGNGVNVIITYYTITEA